MISNHCVGHFYCSALPTNSLANKTKNYEGIDDTLFNILPSQGDLQNMMTIFVALIFYFLDKPISDENHQYSGAKHFCLTTINLFIFNYLIFKLLIDTRKSFRGI